jgi:xanthine/uracil permease
MYANGYCPTGEDGTLLPCPKAYGALLGTAACCSLLEVAISFLPPKVLQKIFPPIVTGPTVMLIGVSLVQTGFSSWAGGSGPCSAATPTDFFAKCPNIAAKHALPWGSAEYIGKFEFSRLNANDIDPLTRPRLLCLRHHPDHGKIWVPNHEVC